MTKSSWVWEYFEETETGGRCKLCNALLKANNTSPLSKHLLCKHRMKKGPDGNVITINNRDNDDPASLAKQRKMRPEVILNSLVKMVVVDILPISFVAEEGFREFVSTIEPTLVIPNELLLENRLQLQYKSIQSQIEEHLSDAKYVALSTECWSANPHVTYLTVNAHYIDQEWKQNVFTLSTVPMKDRENTLDIDTHLTEIAEEWDIKDKVVAIVTENTADMKAAVRKCGFPEYSSNLECAAHTLNLCVTQAFQDSAIADILKKVISLVGYFQHSATAVKELNEKQLSLGIEAQELSQSSPSNWNSTYLMLKSVVESRSALQAVYESQEPTSSPNESCPTLSNSEWETLEELLPCLEPLQLATTTFSRPNSPTSLVRPIINTIINLHLTKSEPTNENRNLSSAFKNTIRKLLIEKFDMDDGQQTEARQLAAMVDPRFRNMLHETQKGKSSIVSALRPLISSPSESGAEDTKPKITMIDKLFQKISTPHQVSNQFDSVLSQIELWQSECPLTWWKQREKKLPALADLARKLLCIPAATAAAERIYSTAGDIVIAKRSAIPHQHVDLLVFLNQNKRFLK